MVRFKKFLKRNWLDLVIAIFLFVVSIVMLYPLMEQIAVSLTTPLSLVTRPTLLWFPLDFTTVAYERIFNEADILGGYKNTLWVMGVGIVITLTMTMISAYFWSRKSYKVKWKDTIVFLIVFTMYFGGGMIPGFLLRRSLGLYDTKWVLVLGGAVSTYNTILLRSFFQSIPDSLEESVELDGGGHFTILFRIYMPLSKAALAVMAMYYGLGFWNDWFSAKIYLPSAKNHTLALILRNKMLEGSVTTSGQTYEVGGLFEELQDTLVAALCISSTLPFLLIYPFLQKYFQGGLMIGSIKG